MNVAEIEGLGNRLRNSHAASVRDAVRQIESIVNGTSSTWIGADADRFRGWWPNKRSRMLAMAHELDGFGQSALNNASEQRQASGESAASGGTATGTSAGGVAAVAGGGAEIGSDSVASAGTGTVQLPRDWRDVSREYDAWATGGFAEGGVSHYQCTGWANFRWQQLGHDGIVSGNGWEMAGNAPGPVSADPSLHAMASYGSGGAGDYGHVMIVEEVSSDGSRIRVSEMNTGSDGSGWQVGNPQEYRDTKWIDRGADGQFRSWNGSEIGFAALPSL